MNKISLLLMNYFIVIIRNYFINLHVSIRNFVFLFKLNPAVAEFLIIVVFLAAGAAVINLNPNHFLINLQSLYWYFYLYLLYSDQKYFDAI